MFLGGGKAPAGETGNRPAAPLPGGRPAELPPSPPLPQLQLLGERHPGAPAGRGWRHAPGKGQGRRGWTPPQAVGQQRQQPQQPAAVQQHRQQQPPGEHDRRLHGGEAGRVQGRKGGHEGEGRRGRRREGHAQQEVTRVVWWLVGVTVAMCYLYLGSFFERMDWAVDFFEILIVNAADWWLFLTDVVPRYYCVLSPRCLSLSRKDKCMITF